MKAKIFFSSLIIAAIFTYSCKNKTKISEDKKEEIAQDSTATTVQTAIGELTLEPPFATEAVAKVSKNVGWQEGEIPTAPQGFIVTRFAEDLEHPRWIYIGANGDIFVAESDDAKSSANKILLFRDTNKDGSQDEKHIFKENLNQPFGMLIHEGHFYVANVDGVVKFPYQEGANQLKGEGETILELPAGGYNHHWTRNLITNKEKNKFYITVGSASNVGEYGMDKEERRARILEINPDGSGEKVYASGIRNPIGIDWNPVTGELWAAVNERDNLGDNIVPDYATSVKKGGFYGWPYAYYGQIRDPRWAEDPHPEMVEKTIVPDVPLGAHTASIGFTFYRGESFPAKYKNGAFVGQHGSWNRSVLSGYKVVFIPFDASGKPQKPQDFLTGFIADREAAEVKGRPVGVTQTPQGDLLVADDDSGIIWRVSADK
ncbi:sorbosone dehydrogenase family protein [Mesonia ostreae]|uniref:Sorbosone dehydrogenase family protein n=1 Tax=Mesonia ostreae TaxID=861110 RepID=A0ABU2KKK6_9FLAO|nr:sorbosone dehydrogenase family protein [Mesonia ostreae]MDT0295219.1 sorbosone dehydrogenase family protein [Mesonia ostreae]